MTNKDYYQETFSQLHGTVRMEELEKRRRRTKRMRPVLGFAAVLCVLAALSAGALAKDWFGLRSLLLPQENAAEGGEASGRMDLIGLQGYAGSPESQALAEWEAFQSAYDPDGALLAQVGNDPTGLEERYAFYFVYTREMADKLDEITERYGLTLYREMNVVDHAELADRLGGEFLGDGHSRYWGYIYDNGTFQIDGDAAVDGFGQVDYQLRRAVKGTFDEVLLDIDDAADYREWPYETESGETALLAMGPGKALILGDFADCFVTVNVLAGSDFGGLTAESLEALADGFDFTVLKTVIQPEMRGDSVPEEEPPADADDGPGGEPAETDDWFYETTGVTRESAAYFAQELNALLQDENRLSVAELLCYPCRVTVAEGEVTAASPEEFLPYYDEVVEQELRTLYAVLEDGELFAADGLVGAGSGEFWFGVVDGSLRLLTIQSPNGAAVCPAA